MLDAFLLTLTSFSATITSVRNPSSVEGKLDSLVGVLRSLTRGWPGVRNRPMTKLLSVGIAACILLSGVPAVASVPDPFHSTMQWFHPVKGDTLIGVCPLGDWSGLDVTLRDQYNLPLGGWEVGLNFADPRVCFVHWISGVTDMNGYVRLVIKAGLNSSAATARVASGYSVLVRGVTMWAGTVSLVSPDYNCNPTVDALDFSFFSLDWPPAAYAARSDFNDDGMIDALDFSLFALHWLHQ